VPGVRQKLPLFGMSFCFSAAGLIGRFIGYFSEGTSLLRRERQLISIRKNATTIAKRAGSILSLAEDFNSCLRPTTRSRKRLLQNHWEIFAESLFKKLAHFGFGRK
jgi:hypothetical protein